jgi:hypothetical protein
MKTQTIKDIERGGRPPAEDTIELRDKLDTFYENHYKDLMTDEKQSSLHLNNILEYTTVSIITMIENNIKQHYIEYIERYINTSFNKDDFMKENNTKEEKNKFISELRKVKKDLLNVENSILKSTSKYHDWIKDKKSFLLPQKEKFEKDSIYYDIQVHPQDYYHCIFYAMKSVEEKDKTIYNICPLRSNIVPKHTKIDTVSIISLFIDANIHEFNQDVYKKNGNLKKYQSQLWSMFFKTKDRVFKQKKNYIFNHMIETDGVSVSIQFIRKDKFGKQKLKTPKFKQQETYITDLSNKDIKIIKDKKIVAIDPNMSDLLFCSSIDKENNTEKLRYTQDQRRKETKSKKYMKMTDKFKQENLIDGMTIKELEATLSPFNKKTLDFNKFKDYIKQKNFINQKLFAFYETYIFRKLNLNAYSNRKRTEDNFMNRFRKKFGKPEEVVVGIGDFEQYKHRKFKEPVKGKGFRDMFRKHGYNIYLVDEHKTSCKCYKCEEGRCDTFRYCQNPRPWKQNITIKRHGLTMCQTCSSIWNRDVNASLNIYEIMRSTLIERVRPDYLKRSKDIIQ